jgi:DNA end-binding protein Ku
MGDDIELRPQEMAMASSLVESLSGDFDPTEYTDLYRSAIESVVEAKIEGRDLIPAPEKADGESSGTVVDLVAALQASIDAAKKGRAGAETAPATSRASAAKKAPAKKTTAKKVAAKAPAAAAAAAKKPVRARRSA